MGTITFFIIVAIGVKCISVGTDDMQDSRSIQTEKIETSHSWTQNLLSNQSKEIKTRSEKFKLMPTDVLMNLVDVTEVLLEEIELERLEKMPKEKRKITNDLEISENMKVRVANSVKNSRGITRSLTAKKRVLQGRR